MSKQLVQDHGAAGEWFRRLEAAREGLLIADYARLRSRVMQLQARARQQLPVDRGLRALEQQLHRAVKRYQARQGWQPHIHFPRDLPISSRRDEILEALKRHQVLIVCGDTGSGKTTQLPKLAWLAGGGRRGLIGCTQPRRLAAVSMARRVAEELHCTLGRHVAYQVRFDNQTTEETAIKFMTDGILLAETLQDRSLNQYDTLIVDEAHERTLNIDFILGYLKNLLPRRPNLKLLISSATLDPESFSKFFHGAPVLTVEGRTYPIEDEFFPPLDPDEDIVRHVGRAVRWVDELDPAGDMLVFLPGEREIRDAAELLRGKKYARTEILPLYARLSLDEQQRVFTVGGRRRIVLATNVAETSITIPGIRYVIDSGLVRLNRYRPRRHIQSRQIEPISQASARQRRGRCGRVADGVCVHLYSEQALQDSPPFTDPEIRRSSLAGVILQMQVLGLPPIEEFPFVEPPSRALVEQGYQTLFEIGAFDDKQRVTPLGRELAQFPLDPQIARMVLRGRDEFVVSEMLVLAAALSIQDPQERPLDRQAEADAAHAQWQDKQSDFFTYLRLWNAWQAARKSNPTSNRLRRWCKANFLSFRRMLEWQNLVRELADLVHELGWKARVQETVHDDSFQDRVHRSILAGIPLHLGVRSETMEYRGTHGRSFYIFPGSGVFKTAPRVVVAFLMVETARTYARIVGAIKPEWVEQVARHLCRYTHHDVGWDAAQGFVYARETVSCGDLTLLQDRRVHYGRINPERARELFIREAMTPGNLRSRSPWLAEHRSLLDDIARLEQKIRRPHGLLDEQAIQEHFHRLLPPDVCSTRGLDQWLQRTGTAIGLTLEQATVRYAEPIRASDYPDELMVHGYRFALRYRYVPGEADDGIVLLCPERLLRSLPPWTTEWLVAGWLPERVRLLIRSLPKPLTAACHPLQAVADDFVSQVRDGRVSAERPLLVALAEYLTGRLAAPVQTDQFQPERVPEHLVMKIAVTDAEGKILRLERIRPEEVTYSSQLTLDSAWLPAEWVRHGMLDWDCASLPRFIELPTRTHAGATAPTSCGRIAEAQTRCSVGRSVRAAEITGTTSEPSRQHTASEVRGYPALLDEGQSVGLAVFLDEAEADAHHRAGVMRLYRLQTARDVTALQKRLPLPMPAQLVLSSLTGEQQSALEDLVDLIVEEAFHAGGTQFPRDPGSFRQRVESARTSLQAHAVRRCEQIGGILEQRRAFLGALNGVRANAGLADCIADMDRQLAFLFRPGFVREPDTWMHYPRYFKALSVRLERLRVDPSKDRTKWESIRPFQERFDQSLAQLSGKPIPPALGRFARLLQEFRVARFAPEVGAAEKVSPRRLEAAWLDVAKPVRRDTHS